MIDTCQHVLEAFGDDRRYCGKPARFHLPEYDWKLCGIHARFWRDRHFQVVSCADPASKER